MIQAKPGLKNMLLVFGVSLSAATLGIQVFTITSARAQTKTAPQETQPRLRDFINQAQPQITNTNAPASICYTCGGYWPNYGGTIPTQSAATERNAQCGTFNSGAEFAVDRNDTVPFLCTK